MLLLNTQGGCWLCCTAPGYTTATNSAGRPAALPSICYSNGKGDCGDAGTAHGSNGHLNAK
jgi:hypothetical protein